MNQNPIGAVLTAIAAGLTPAQDGRCVAMIDRREDPPTYRIGGEFVTAEEFEAWESRSGRLYPDYIIELCPRPPGWPAADADVGAEPTSNRGDVDAR